MGNASGRQDGEGTSGVKKREEDGYEQPMELGQGEAHISYHAHGDGVFLDTMVNSPRCPRVLQNPAMFASEVSMEPFSGVEENWNYYHEVSHEKPEAVMIAWSDGGKQVAVTGSWDNWENVEPLWPMGDDFTIIKMLLPGVYHYHFIVDEQLRFDPDLPWGRNELGSAYNILELKEHVPEALQTMSEFESPPSPISSYDNQSLSDGDFAKPPPDLPPHLQMTLLNRPSSSTASDQSPPMPELTTLNHLYIQNSDGNSDGRQQPVALGSTFRFRQKFVTVVLYRPSQRR
ncbi:SNF1-related protein kinase regulatory subunit beta-2-like [Melia azedarach]|nr:SNF1-related protein kinase regulatory subunit beta-2-like [Melia azedarach]